MESPCTGEEEVPECYVCADRKPCDRLCASQCACKGRFIHDSCLKKLVQSQKVAICMVCKEPYTNVEVRTRYVRVWGTRYGVSIILTVVVALFLGASLSCMTLYVFKDMSTVAELLIVTLAVVSLAIAMAAVAMIVMAVSFGGGLGRVRREGMHRAVAEVTVAAHPCAAERR